MSLNKAILIGYVGKEPNIRYVDNGVCTAAFPLATTTPGYTLPNGTKVPERTEWHNILLWRKIAETAEKYVHKGDKLYIEGEIRTRSYQDKKGITRYVTEIWGKEMEMLSPRNTNTSTVVNVNNTQKAEKDASSTNQDQLPF